MVKPSQEHEFFATEYFFEILAPFHILQHF